MVFLDLIPNANPVEHRLHGIFGGLEPRTAKFVQVGEVRHF
jgi:hypothetical protein